MCCAMHSVCIVEMMLVCSMFVRSYMCTQMTARLRQYMYARVVTRQRQGMPRSCELYLMRPESSSDRFFLPCLNLNLPRCGMSNSLGTSFLSFLIRSLRNIVGPLSLTLSDITSDLNNLVRTFRSAQHTHRDARAHTSIGTDSGFTAATDANSFLILRDALLNCKQYSSAH